MVTRRFWPHGAGTHESAAAAVTLAQAWSAAGHRVEVVTAKYGPHWATEFDFGPVRVHRLASAPRGDWASARYVRHLGHWLADHATADDTIVAAVMRDDVPAVQAATARRGSRGIVICGGIGNDADTAWCGLARGGHRTIASASALTTVVTHHASSTRFLIGQGIAPEKIRCLEMPIPRRTASSPDIRSAARLALRVANSDLTVGDDTRVLLWCGAMRGVPGTPGGLTSLVASARFLLRRYENLRIWLVGDGPSRDWVHTELKAEGVRSLVAMPGSFADMTDVLDAVDGLVVSDDETARDTIWAALGRGLPLILPESPAWRMTLGLDAIPSPDTSPGDDRGMCVSWYSSTQPKSLRRAVRLAWDDPSTTEQLACQLGDQLSRDRPMIQYWNQWREILGS